jgi:RIO kinase 1
MEYIGDESMAAPLLIDVTLPAAAAPGLFERLLHNIGLMLQHGWVHGDLSAYNVLYWADEITLIDFPQVVNPHTNPDARSIFGRDIERVCGYFARYGVRSHPRQLARDLWRRYIQAPPQPWLERDS